VTWAPGPPLPDDVTGNELDADVREELRGLSAARATTVARHLVMAGRLLDSDPEAAYAHALAAQRSAPRTPAAREAAGVAAYLTGRYADALAELRAARRLSGSDVHLPMIADCERGLGRPQRALELAGSPAAGRLDRAGQIEMRIVAAGARQDLGQRDAAVVTLQIPELSSMRASPEIARLRYAYAEALLLAGRGEEALSWLRRAVEADPEGETGAADRLDELEGTTFLDLEEQADAEEAGPEPGVPAGGDLNGGVAAAPG
jgi:tetratricopeptide (TPR) repeat protein